MVKKLYIVILFMILFNIFNVNALDFEAGDFISKDNNHKINISTDGTTIIYDELYSLSLQGNTTGNKITGKVGTNNVTLTLYQINSSKVMTGSVINYQYNGENIYLYDYTVFSKTKTPVEDNNGIFELWSNDAKKNNYADLQSAVDAASNGDTIKITDNFDAVGGVYIQGKNITIDGTGKKINASTWSNGIFIVEEDATLTIKNLKIDGGSTGFEVDYDATAYDKTAIPLVASSTSTDIKQNVSAVITKGNINTLKMEINNYYTTLGAMSIISGNANIEKSKFNHNRASSRGGALNIGRNFKQTETTYPVKNVTIDESEFTLNYSTKGGAINIYNTEIFNVIDSKFISNTVTGSNGGAILYNTQSASGYNSMAEKLGLDFMQSTIDNCLFENNWVGNDGSAIENNDAEIELLNSEFKNNVGTHYSGSIAAYSMHVYREEWANEKIYNCIFDGNIGAVAAIGDHGSHHIIDIQNVKFRNNVGIETVYLLTSVGTLKNLEFENEDVYDAVIKFSGYADISDYNSIETKRPSLVFENIKISNTKNNNIGILVDVRGYDRLPELEIKGYIDSDIHMWDNTNLTVNGTINGNVYIAKDTPIENISIQNGKINGEIINKNNYSIVSLNFSDETTKQLTNYDKVTLYLEKDKTYTDKELYMMHLLSKENKKIAYYTDKEHTTLWNYSANSSITLYGQYEDHTHSYNEYMLYDNKIYRQCDCGYFDKKLYIEVSENITINSLNENIKVINELGIEANEYQINYKKLSEGGTWIEYNGIPNEIGEFKVELTFNELTISNEFTITDNIKTPNTYDGILNTILLGILVLIGLLSVTNLVIKKI